MVKVTWGWLVCIQYQCGNNFAEEQNLTCGNNFAEEQNLIFDYNFAEEQNLPAGTPSGSIVFVPGSCFQVVRTVKVTEVQIRVQDTTTMYNKTRNL